MTTSFIHSSALFIGLSLSVAACKKEPEAAPKPPEVQTAPAKTPANSDAALTKKMVGTWREDRTMPNGTRAEGTSTYAADGTREEEAKVISGGKTQVFQAKGKWEIKGGEFHETITEFPQMPARVGTKTTLKIISLTDTEFVYEDSQGEKHTARRQKK